MRSYVTSRVCRVFLGRKLVCSFRDEGKDKARRTNGWCNLAWIWQRTPNFMLIYNQLCAEATAARYLPTELLTWLPHFFVPIYDRNTDKCHPMFNFASFCALLFVAGTVRMFRILSELGAGLAHAHPGHLETIIRFQSCLQTTKNEANGLF